MKTIHIKGFAENIDLSNSLSNNYDFGVSLPYDGFLEKGEIGKDTLKDVFFRFYECDTECTLDEAVKGYLTKMFGSLEVQGSEYGYSEYTIEGFCVDKLTLGGHDLQNILKNKKGKYLHVLIDVIKR